MATTMVHEQRGKAGDRIVWAMAAILWLLPLLAAQISSEMDWSVSDFVVWAFMLGSAAGVYHLATRLSGNRAYRAGAAIAVATAFLITWSNLAVGIIGSEDNPLNQIFFVVLAIGLCGALYVRLEARRMVRVMQLTAIAQALTAVVALVVDGAYIFAITGVFIALWLLAAGLFRKAAQANENAPAVK